MISLIEKETCAQFFTARCAQDAKNAKIMFFYRIGTDGSVKQSALRAFRKMFTFHTERIMAVFSNRPFRFGKGFAAFAPLRFNPTEEPVSHERCL